jgi:integrase
VILSLTTGIRTEEARALRWDHVDLDGDPEAWTPVPPSIAVWRSVRLHGDTKTEKSRRTLALPQSAVAALREHRKWQASSRLAAGPLWQDTGLVFTTSVGTPLDASHVRRDFRSLCKKAGIEGVWAPRELRHTFVSVMSVSGVAVEEIARLAGHASSRTATQTGEALDLAAMPAGLVGRRTQVNLDLARAYAMTRKDAAAVNLLLAAERLSPQLVRYDQATHDVLTELLRREHRPSTPELRPLARRAGVI